MSSEIRGILQSHKKVGYPALSEEDQARLLLTGDVEIINAIPSVVRAKELPHFLVRHYVKLKKAAFKKYFLKSDHVDKWLAQHKAYPMADGLHIVELPNGKFEAQIFERGSPYDVVLLANRDELNNYLIDQIYFQFSLDGRLEK
jgi:hypothetical protein